MPGITNFDISYGGALAPVGFHRMTQKDGSPAELNKGCSGASSYLWYHTGDNQGDPIVELLLIDVSEDTPEGFERMNRTFMKNGRSGKVLCFRRSTEVDPIGSVTLVFSNSNSPEEGIPDDVAIPEGYEILPINANPEGSQAAYLCFNYTSKDAPPVWSPHVLKVGDWVDAKDTVNKWCVAQVVEANEEVVKIHYKGWAAKWDEEVPRSDTTKLSEHGTHTKGKDTGYGRRAQGDMWELPIESIRETQDRMLSIFQAMNEDQKVSEEDEQFMKGDLPAFVEKCLTSTIDPPEHVPAMNGFLKHVFMLIVFMLRRPTALPTHLENM